MQLVPCELGSRTAPQEQANQRNVGQRRNFFLQTVELANPFFFLKKEKNVFNARLCDLSRQGFTSAVFVNWYFVFQNTVLIRFRVSGQKSLLHTHSGSKEKPGQRRISVDKGCVAT